MADRLSKVPKNATREPSPPRQETVATGGRRERKLQNTIDHIGAVAWDLFETHGFDAVTMEAIAEAADVAKGTLYKRFPVKEALIQHRFESDLAAQRDTIAAAVMAMPTCAERLARLFREQEFYAENRRCYMIPYLRYRLSVQTGTRTPSSFERFVASLLRLGQASGEIATDMSADQMAEYLSFLRLAALMRWLAAPDASLRTIHDEMLDLFLNGVSRKVPR